MAGAGFDSCFEKASSSSVSPPRLSVAAAVRPLCVQQKRASLLPFFHSLVFVGECVVVLQPVHSHSLPCQLPRHFVSDTLARDAEDGRLRVKIISSPIACLKPAPKHSRRPTRTITVTPVPCSLSCSHQLAPPLPGTLSACRHALFSWPDDARPQRLPPVCATQHRDGCTCLVNPIETAVSPPLSQYSPSIH